MPYIPTDAEEAFIRTLRLDLPPVLRYLLSLDAPVHPLHIYQALCISEPECRAILATLESFGLLVLSGHPVCYSVNLPGLAQHSEGF